MIHWDQTDEFGNSLAVQMQEEYDAKYEHDADYRMEDWED